mmetsp:Transcript_119449/g.254892  ORF Transcript_119449/g.254892 Transcript_119449/m.254892 type:complete len:218 (+) Transcript_119449:4977-5630(+)
MFLFHVLPRRCHCGHLHLTFLFCGRGCCCRLMGKTFLTGGFLHCCSHHVYLELLLCGLTSQTPLFSLVRCRQLRLTSLTRFLCFHCCDRGLLSQTLFLGLLRRCCRCDELRLMRLFCFRCCNCPYTNQMLLFGALRLAFFLHVHIFKSNLTSFFRLLRRRRRCGQLRLNIRFFPHRCNCGVWCQLLLFWLLCHRCFWDQVRITVLSCFHGSLCNLLR